MPPGPRPVLVVVGEPDITPAGTINQGDSKTITWLCKNTGDAPGQAALRIDQVSPVQATGLFLSGNISIPVGQTVPVEITSVYNLAPGDYIMQVTMLDATGVSLPAIASRTFPLTIAQLVPRAILTAGTLVIT